MLANAPGKFYLTVSPEGLVSLWDTLEKTNAHPEDTLVVMQLTPVQLFDLERAQRIAASRAVRTEARRARTNA